MIKEKLAIIIGHTDNNSGASMIAPFDYIQEYEYNTVLAGIISAIAVDRGIKCKVILRDGVGITKAYAEAAEYEPKAIIELHFNAFTNGAPKGTETLYGSIPRSFELAEAVQEQICAVFDRTPTGGGDRGTKKKNFAERGGRSVNNDTEIPTVLIEPFFGSNRTDAINALLNIKELAEAILVGFLDFIYYDDIDSMH